MRRAELAFTRYEAACRALDARCYYRHRGAEFSNIDRFIANSAGRAVSPFRIPGRLKLPGLSPSEPSAQAIQALLAMADLIGINCSAQRKEAFLDLMSKVFAADDE